MDKGDRLYDRIGMSELFNPSELLGNVGFRLSGHSSPSALIPIHWRLSNLGDQPKCEMALTPVCLFKKILKLLNILEFEGFLWKFPPDYGSNR